MNEPGIDTNERCTFYPKRKINKIKCIIPSTQYKKVVTKENVTLIKNVHTFHTKTNKLKIKMK